MPGRIPGKYFPGFCIPALCFIFLTGSTLAVDTPVISVSRISRMESLWKHPAGMFSRRTDKHKAELKGMGTELKETRGSMSRTQKLWTRQVRIPADSSVT